ncbi:glycosyltransferase [Desulfovibrio inopinatus]|uniref:glycosyltransferase n=1 Tax=Desulfovibrio inopinatus TaxID=102109 RepID=UPI00042460CC|nr:glycosyltransferase [Desulfovibrio inopinatus]
MTTSPTASIIIAAHNEEAVLEHCLHSITADMMPDEFEIIVVPNGCTDTTAAIARAFGETLQTRFVVKETEKGNKCNAINLGETASTCFPRIYLDADVTMDTASMREFIRVLGLDGVMAASPRLDLDLSQSSMAVRAYYRIWQQLPYARNLIGGGVYGLSCAGRGRFGEFPDLLAEDEYIRRLYDPQERVVAHDAVFHLGAPRTLRDFIAVRSRHQRSLYQLEQQFPELKPANPESYKQRILGVLANPRNWFDALLYGMVTVTTRIKGFLQFTNPQRRGAWDRDNSSRVRDHAKPETTHSLAWLVSEYPAVSHAFIYREVMGLRQRGFIIRTYSINSTRNRMVLGEAEQREAAFTHVLKTFNPWLIGRAKWSVFRASPGGYMRLVGQMFRLFVTGPKSSVRALAYFVGAVRLIEDMRRHGLKHVHVHFANPAATVAMLAASTGLIEYSMSVHGPYEFYNIDADMLAEKARRAVFIRAIGWYCRSRLLRILESRNWGKVDIVRLGVNTLHYAPLHHEASSVPIILCVGRLDPAKGQRVLLAALARLVRQGLPFQAVFVGDGPDRSELKTLTISLDLADSVRFTGPLSQDDVFAWYKQADVFVLPSFDEGIPVVLMEAMAMGVACLSTRVAGIPELIDETSGLLVWPGDEAGLAEALARLLRGPDLRSRLATGARQVIINHYDIETNLDRLAALFANRLAESSV